MITYLFINCALYVDKRNMSGLVCLGLFSLVMPYLCRNKYINKSTYSQ